MPNQKRKRVNPWPKRSQIGRGGKVKGWQPHPTRKGWEINIMTMDERKAKKKK